MLYADWLKFLSSNVSLVFQETLQLLITVMLLTDLSVTLLTLLQFYWISLGAFLSILLILPLSLLSPFPAGLNALFSKEPRKASLARVYALWNATSLCNIVSYKTLWCYQLEFSLHVYCLWARDHKYVYLISFTSARHDIAWGTGEDFSRIRGH